MTYPRLVAANVPKKLEAAGQSPVYRKPESDHEFFVLLKEKIGRDFERFFKEKDVEKRWIALTDIMTDFSYYTGPLTAALVSAGKDPDKIGADRVESMGPLDTVVESVVNDIDKQKAVVMAYGEEHGWPGMVLARNSEGKPYLTLLAGKPAWETNINDAKTFPEAFRGLVEAVKRGDNGT